jgi:photosystem II stability/assembly factor-like uncharacterized protein
VRSNDSGRTWSIQNSNTVQGLVGVHFSDTKLGTAVGWNGTIIRTTDAGVTWSNQNNPLSGTYLDLWGIYLASSTNGIATGEDGTILRTTNGGDNWYTISGGTGDKLWSISFGDSLTGMIAGDSISKGRLLKTTDGGKNWSMLSNDSTPTLFGIAMSGPNSAFAVGQSGTILRTTSGGTVWVKDGNRTGVIDHLILSQNYPNPFNPSTFIRYSVPTAGKVKLTIYDMLGQTVDVLINEEQSAGYHGVEWRANVASGIYFYGIEAVDVNDPNNRFVQVKKMLLLK